MSRSVFSIVVGASRAFTVGVRAIGDEYLRAAKFVDRLIELFTILEGMNLSGEEAMPLADILTEAARAFGEGRVAAAAMLIADVYDILTHMNVSSIDLPNFRLKARNICLDFCGSSPI